jgi:hypothetical protein
MDSGCCTARPATRWEKLRSKWATLKHETYMKLHKNWWGLLHLTRIARPYSVSLCKLNLYRKFPDGRCHWCGEVHQ